MTTFAEFESAFFDPDIGVALQDGIPLHVLEQLSPPDRARAALALQARLEQLDRPGRRPLDDWAIGGLGQLAALGTPIPDATVPLLRTLLPRKRGALKAEIALAIWQIAKDETMLDVLLELSRTSALGARLHSMIDRYATDYDLVQVMYALARFPQSAARRRLEELTRDPRYLVRANAGTALDLRRAAYGITDES